MSRLAVVVVEAEATSAPGATIGARPLRPLPVLIVDTTSLKDTVRLRDALAGSTAVMVVTDGQDTPLSASTAHGLSDVLDDMIRRARPDMGRADRY